MKKEDLLRNMGDIREEYVEEAWDNAKAVEAGENGENEAEPVMHGAEYKEIKVGVKKKAVWKWTAGIAAALLICIGIGTAIGNGDLLNMGGMGAADRGFYSEDMASVDYEMPEMEENFSDKQATVSSEEYIKASEMAGGVQNNAAMGGPAEPNVMGELEEQREVAAQDEPSRGLKLIYRANVSVETQEYGETVAFLENLVKEYYGYFESRTDYNGSLYDEDVCKDGHFTIRLPQESYEAFLNILTEKCHVSNMSQSVEDVGESYFEIEGRLENLRIKEERLQDLLKQSGNMSDMIEVENALSDVEYQIDMYTSSLNHYDSLINYSTVYLDVTEVVHYQNGINVDQGFGAQLLRGLKSGAENFADFLQAIVLWIAYNIIFILVLVVIIIVLRKFHVVSKISEKLHKKHK